MHGIFEAQAVQYTFQDVAGLQSVPEVHWLNLNDFVLGRHRLHEYMSNAVSL